MIKILPIIVIFMSLSSCGYVPTNHPIVIEDLSNPSLGINDLTIDFMSWNIHKEGNDKNWIKDILNSNCTKNPDIILFQEASLNTGLKYALQVKNINWKFLPNAIKDNRYTGVLTASNSLGINQISLISPAKEPFTETPKVILVTSHVLNSGGAVLVANVHGLNFVCLSDFKDQIEDLYNKLLPFKNHPIIISGDFNTWSSERVSILEQFFPQLDLYEETVNNATTPPWYVWFFTTAEKLPLDRIYYSHKKLSIISSEALDCVESSDHKPIYIKFKIL